MDKQPKQQRANMPNHIRLHPSNQLDPFTPIQPSTTHVNDLSNDCIRLFLEHFETLQDLVEKAFVCPRWLWVVHQILRTRQNSLKVFDTELNIDTYQDLAVTQYKLDRLDPKVGVNQTRNEMEDHIILRSFPRVNNFMYILVQLFADVKNLVLHTLFLDHVKLIKGMKNLTSITLVELPDSRKDQNNIWEALNECSALRHVHIFYINGNVPFTVEKMDFLNRIESLTLDNYKYNLHAILNRLSSECRWLHIGPNLNENTCTAVLQKLTAENPQALANLSHIGFRGCRILTMCAIDPMKNITFHLWDFYNGVVEKVKDQVNENLDHLDGGRDHEMNRMNEFPSEDEDSDVEMIDVYGVPLKIVKVWGGGA